MKGKTPLLLLAVAVGFVALIIGLLFFFYYLKPLPNVEVPKSANSSPSKSVKSSLPPSREIKESEVTSLSINTVYPGFFAADSKCRKTYNEMFGNDDGIASSSSPCTINITFNRDGKATKKLDLQRYDKTVKEKKSIEKSAWTAKISESQFAELAKLIVNNQAFKNWIDGTSVTVSNSSVSVKYDKGIRTVMSNVDVRTTAFLPMLDAFKKLDLEVKWESTQ